MTEPASGTTAPDFSSYDAARVPVGDPPNAPGKRNAGEKFTDFLGFTDGGKGEQQDYQKKLRERDLDVKINASVDAAVLEASSKFAEQQKTVSKM